MKVAFDARYLNQRTSGVGTYCESLLRALGKYHPELEFLLVTRKPGLAATLPELRAKELLFDAAPRSLRTAYHLSLRLRSERCDLFHGPFNILPSFLPTPSVVTVHDLMQLENPANIAKSRFVQNTAGFFWRTRLRHAIAHATRILTVSSTTRDTLFEYFPSVPEGRVVAAPLGLNPYFLEKPSEAELEQAKACVSASRFVLNVGNESPHKNHHRAIQAFVEAFSDDRDIKFVIVRRLVRHDRELIDLLSKPEVADRVVLLDFTELPLLRALYHLAHIFFFPSWVEGFGIPVLEAMASGTPVLTSDRSALREVAGDAALLASPFSVSAMAEGLRLLDKDTKVRADLVARGHGRVREFTWQRCAERTRSVYEQAIAGGIEPR